MGLAYPIEVAVEEEISEELSQETWLSELKIEEAIEETVEESNGILETLQKAIEEHRADVEDAIKEANVPLSSCSRGEASALADVTDARLVDLMADDDAVTAGGAQSSAELAAPVSVGLGLEATTEAMPADLVAGEETIGLHGIPPAQAAPETDAGLTVAEHEHVTTAGVQQAVNHIEPRDPLRTQSGSLHFIASFTKTEESAKRPLCRPALRLKASVTARARAA